DLVDLCGQTWQGDGLLLRSHPASRRFYFVAPDTDCGLWLRAAAPGDRIRFQFRFFLVYSLTPAAPNASSAGQADPCAFGSYLQFYEGPPGAPRPLGAPLCGLTIPAPVASSGDFLGLRLVTRGRQPRVDFVGEVTSFRLGTIITITITITIIIFMMIHLCIPQSLVCDRWGMDNCGDGSDQASRPPADCTGPRLQGVALASSLLLASAGLLIGLLCHESWLPPPKALTFSNHQRPPPPMSPGPSLPDQWGDVAWCGQGDPLSAGLCL
ncbi:Low-density lipoprotein receptor class A domain-containing protein 2, partial [Camelus dromedarius]